MYSNNMFNITNMPKILSLGNETPLNLSFNNDFLKLLNSNTRAIWQQDDKVNECNKCKCSFSMMTRRHHCRSCGHIFCHNCSSKKKKLPKTIINIPRQNSNGVIKEYYDTCISKLAYSHDTGNRVCDRCYDTIDLYDKVSVYFDILKFLTIKDVISLLMTSKSCYMVSQFYVHTFKNIQHKLLMQKMSTYEVNILRLNSQYINGHNRLMSQYIRCFNSIEFLNNPKCSCKNLYCSYKCYGKLVTEDVIQLLYECNINSTMDPDVNLNEDVKKYLLECIENISDEELLLYSNIFAKIVSRIKEKDIVLDYVVDKAIRNNTFLYSVFWELERMRSENNLSISQLFTDNIKNRNNNETNLLLGNIMELYTDFDRIESRENKIDYIKSLFRNRELNIVPFGIKSINIEIGGITTLSSKSKPTILPLKCIDKNNNLYIKKLLYKNDNIIKDHVICKIIRLMIYFLKKENIIDIDIITYSVLAITNKSGFIEMIHDSITLHDIIHNKKASIVNYIFDNNTNEITSLTRHRYMISLAFYSVITYLLGIGDRHLENIMIHKSGSIFHIDYGYILGDDPKFVSSAIKINQDMMDALGSRDGEAYKNFIPKCSQIYNALRKHAGIISTMCKLLSDDKDIGFEDKIITEILKRFDPSEKDIMADVHIGNLVNSSCESYKSSVNDTLHALAKKWWF